MIEVNNLQKNYGSKEALKGIDFKVKEGEIFGLLGPNGAGKSTTINILTGQLPATAGEASIFQLNVFNQTTEIRPRMGVVPENTNLYERLTIQQNLEFFCKLYEVSYDNIDFYLDIVGLKDEKNTQIKDLSKGMKQKTLLIRALLHEPEVLFLDEPTSGLDPASAEKIHRVLRDLNDEGITILLSSHNMEEVDKLCDRVAFLNQGKIAAIGSPQQLKLDYASDDIKVIIESDNSLEEKTLNMKDTKNINKIHSWMKDGKLKSIHSREPTLADIFVELTGSDLL